MSLQPLINMALFLQIIQDRHANIRRNRVFRDRLNPLDAYNDREIVARYRLSRQMIIKLYDLIGADLEPQTHRNHAIPGMLQIFVALRYYACGTFQHVVGDCHGIHRSSVSRIVPRVTNALCQRKHIFIKFPTVLTDVVATKP